MSEQEAAEKEFEATPRKLEKARKDGDIPIGQDVLTAAVYAALILTFVAAGQQILIRFGDFMSLFLTSGAAAPMTLGALLLGLFVILVPIFAAPILAALGAAIAQNALVFAPKRLAPKLSKISPLKGVQKKLGANGLFEFAKSALKLVIFTGLLAYVGATRLDEIVGLAASEGRLGLTVLLALCRDFLVAAAVAVGLIAVLDYLWQRASHLRKQRMSRKEMTDESKDSDGDPHLKQARRQRANEIATNRMLADVPGADVVITNPTHFAVVLKWDRSPGSAPRCVAKGTDAIAARIREIAGDARVPVFEDPPTARALFATVEIGSEIHPDHYRAVAAAIRFADTIRKDTRT